MDLQHIQWFPGHMTKAVRMMEDNIKLCDGVMFVLDARAPFACFNSRLEKLFAQKPVLYVLNKCDTVTPSDRDKIISALKKQGKNAVAVVGTESKSCRGVYNAFMDMLKEKIERNRAKGVIKPMRAMVAGVPNTGKSTVINSLSGRKVALTGDKAGVTRGKQWIRLNGFELLDTPGTMPPSVENNRLALHLAYIGSLNDSLLDGAELCLSFIGEIVNICPSALSERYAIQVENRENLEIFESICTKRGCIGKGGSFDYERCAKIVIDDFRSGKLGKICLEAKEL